MNQDDFNHMISNESWIYEAEQNDIFSTEISGWVDSTADAMLQETQKIISQSMEYKQLVTIYTCAMKTVRTKFDILNTEFNARLQRNPIKSISTRLKKTSSLMEKMHKLNLPMTMDAIRANIFDVAGVRVVCSYIDDIYEIADALLGQDDVELVQKKDYITYPKPNGYRSLHLIVSVPVYFSKQVHHVNVEVQIRTIAMDFWASLEHQLKYKKEIPNAKTVYAQLKSCADLIHATDEKMLAIRQELEKGADSPTSEDLLVHSISQLGMLGSEKKH